MGAFRPRHELIVLPPKGDGCKEVLHLVQHLVDEQRLLHHGPNNLAEVGNMPVPDLADLGLSGFVLLNIDLQGLPKLGSDRWDLLLGKICLAALSLEQLPLYGPPALGAALPDPCRPSAPALGGLRLLARSVATEGVIDLVARNALRLVWPSLLRPRPCPRLVKSARLLVLWPLLLLRRWLGLGGVKASVQPPINARRVAGDEVSVNLL
mmetsp:Transcript_77164/g.178980  ORF Transcript_77164/g.178980 Transcript_77164/m.178980 type:complete len:209 (+) Transcript_77164:454-1080(+)